MSSKYFVFEGIFLNTKINKENNYNNPKQIIYGSIPTIYQQETDVDMRLGNNFLKCGEIISTVCKKTCHVLMNAKVGTIIPAHIEELLDKVCSENP